MYYTCVIEISASIVISEKQKVRMGFTIRILKGFSRRTFTYVTCKWKRI